MQPAKVLCVLALLTTPALAETTTTDMSHSHMSMDASPATAAYEAANMQMHEQMAIDYTGNADVDFIKGMIPHHQGAVEMAQIVLQYGTDPEVRKLAEGIIAAQEAEIAWMTEWLAQNGQ